jgi:hypothetical protein
MLFWLLLVTANNQQWLGPSSDTGNTILFKDNDKKCLDLPGGSTDNGNVLQIWDCTDQPNQMWYYEANTQTIRYKGDSNKCVDLPGGDTTNGNKLQVNEGGVWEGCGVMFSVIESGGARVTG